MCCWDDGHHHHGEELFEMNEGILRVLCRIWTDSKNYSEILQQQSIPQYRQIQPKIDVWFEHLFVEIYTQGIND